MKIIVSGGSGQLGKALGALTSASRQILPLGSRQLDVTDPGQVNSVISQSRPDAVIHAAAFTAVDAAETAADQAFRVNVLGSRNIAAACLEQGCKLIYVSSDYVFDGRQRRPYTEFDPPNPLNVYGKSKYAGERAAAVCPRLFIVRTSWLYGQGRNFVATILSLARRQDSLDVVDDQTGSPTYSADLARGILALAETNQYGTYHLTNQGECTWYEFARTILRLAGLNTAVRPVATAAFPRPAVRPAYSVLRNYMLELSGGTQFRHWEDALAEYMKGR